MWLAGFAFCLQGGYACRPREQGKRLRIKMPRLSSRRPRTLPSSELKDCFRFALAPRRVAAGDRLSRRSGSRRRECLARVRPSFSTAPLPALHRPAAGSKNPGARDSASIRALDRL